MRWSRRCNCLPLIAACAIALGQDPAVDHDSSRQRSLELRFSLAPVSLLDSLELRRATTHYRQGDWAATVDEVTPILGRQPDHPHYDDGLFLRAESLLQLGRYQDARRDFEALVSRSAATSRIAHVTFRAAETTLLLGELQDAKQRLEQFRATYPQHELNAFVVPYLAGVAAKLGQKPLARQLYSESLSQFPNGPLAAESKLRIALLDYDRHNYDAARELLAALVAVGDDNDQAYWIATYWLAMCDLKLGKLRSALDRFQRLIKVRPDHELAPSCHFHIAEAFKRNGQLDDASAAITTLQSRWPTHSITKRSIVMEMDLAAAGGDLDRTISLYESLEGGPLEGRVDATRIVVQVLLAKQRYAEADALIRPLATAATRRPSAKSTADHFRDLYLFALAQRGLGNLGKAIQLLGRIRLNAVVPELGERVALARIETHNQAGDYNDAVKQAEMYQELFPTGRLHSAVGAQVVIALAHAGQFDKAEVALRQLQSSPNASNLELAIATRHLAERALALRKLSTAEKAFQALAESYSTDDDLAQAISGLAWVALEEGKKSIAAARFEEFLVRFPNHRAEPECRRALAQTLVQLGQRSKAIRILTAFDTDAVKSAAQEAGLLQLAGLLYRDSQTLDHADQIVSRLLAQPQLDRRDAALYLSGLIQHAQGKPHAQEAFEEVVQRHPTSQYWADALYRLAEMTSRKEPDAARQHLTKLISSERSRRVIPHALYLKGRLETEDQDWRSARNTLRLILSEFPESPLVELARYGIAEAHFQDQQYEKALELFQFLDQPPSRTESWRGMVWFRLAQLKVKQQDLVGAIKTANRIEKNLDNFPLQHEVHYLIARAHSTRGEFSSARAYYDKVVRADPNDEREITQMAKWMIGESYLHQKHFAQSIKAFQRLTQVEQFPKWQAVSYLQIGKCYEKLGQADLAQEAYGMVVAQFGDSEYARDAGDRLHSLAPQLEQPSQDKR